MKSLTYQEALLLLPAVVDGEATESEKAAFFDFIKYHHGIREEYKSALLVKHILKNKLPRHNAPEHLKESIIENIRTIGSGKRPDKPNEIAAGLKLRYLKQNPESDMSNYYGLGFRYLAAAAVVLIITLAVLRLLDQTTAGTSSAESIIVENIAAHHFQLTGGQFIEPYRATATVAEAENYLAEHFDINLTVPPITGAKFAGIVFAEFVENYRTPLLEYVQEEIGETIYIFVFDLADIDAHEKLKRHDEAVKTCIYSHDFYVTEIDQYHVVSWLWDNNWYTAISNHNGYDLASLIVPLNP
jgi:hypothetical protein